MKLSDEPRPPLEPSLAAHETSHDPAPDLALVLLILLGGTALAAWWLLGATGSPQASHGRVPALRALGAMWGWVGLALFQAGVPEGIAPKTGTRRGLLQMATRGAIAAGAGAFFAWLALEAGSLRLVAAGLLLAAALLGALRCVRYLSGRSVTAADAFFFISVEWMLVWAAAEAGTVFFRPLRAALIQHQVTLFGLAAVGFSGNVLLGAGLRALPAALGLAAGRPRAWLVSLLAYNAGAVVLVMGYPWAAGPLLVLGVLFYAMGFTGSAARRVEFLALLSAAALLAVSQVLANWEWASAAWQQVFGYGFLGLGVVAGIGAVAQHAAPAGLGGRGLFWTAYALLAAGALMRAAVGFQAKVSGGTFGALALAAGLETAGVFLAALASLRVAMVRRRVAVRMKIDEQGAARGQG